MVDVDGSGIVVLRPVMGRLVVVRVQQVRAETAVQIVVVRATHQPVVAEVAEEGVFVEAVIAFRIGVQVRSRDRRRARRSSG